MAGGGGLGASPYHPGTSDDGLITVRSTHPVAETIDRLVLAVTSRGLTVFARVDHVANADQVQLELRPTQLVTFGNPRVGASLMQDCQSRSLLSLRGSHYD